MNVIISHKIAGGIGAFLSQQESTYRDLILEICACLSFFIVIKPSKQFRGLCAETHLKNEQVSD